MISWERKTKIHIGGGRYNSVCRPNLVGNSSMDLPCGASALLHREYGREEGRRGGGNSRVVEGVGKRRL